MLLRLSGDVRELLIHSLVNTVACKALLDHLHLLCLIDYTNSANAHRSANENITFLPPAALSQSQNRKIHCGIIIYIHKWARYSYYHLNWKNNPCLLQRLKNARGVADEEQPTVHWVILREWVSEPAASPSLASLTLVELIIALWLVKEQWHLHGVILQPLLGNPVEVAASNQREVDYIALPFINAAHSETKVNAVK